MAEPEPRKRRERDGAGFHFHFAGAPTYSKMYVVDLCTEHPGASRTRMKDEGNVPRFPPFSHLANPGLN